MSDSKKPPKGGSGEHPAVVAFREKLNSIAEHTVPAAEELVARIERLKAKSDHPPKDPRREEDDEEEEIPVDVVKLPDKKR